MKQFNIYFETLSPVVITEKSGDSNMVATKDYIPGTTIHGLIAKLHIKQNNIDNLFYDLFFSDKISFGNAYPCENEKKYFPTPFSIQKHKLKECVYDLLFEDDSFNEQTKSTGNFSLITAPNSIESIEVKTTINFHNVIDDGVTLKKGGVFNYSAIDKGQTFASSIIGEENALKQILNLISDDSTHFIGRSKTSQYGCVKITKSDIVDYEKPLDTDERNENTMTLLSDAIVLNDNGMSEVSNTVMSKILGVDILESLLKKDTFENYVNVLKAKRPSVNIFKAGSCFKLEKLPEKFVDMEKFGLGERRNEGFGRVIFNYQKELDENSEINMIKPTFHSLPYEDNLPETTEKILFHTLKSKIRNKLIKEAIEEAEKFNNRESELITNSLAYRLKGFSEAGIDNFLDNLKSLKDTAKKSLENCSNNNENLCDFLNKSKGYFYGNEEYTGRIKSIVNDFPKFPTSVREQLGEDFNKEIEKLFFEKFFTHFRFMNKTKNKETI